MSILTPRASREERKEILQQSVDKYLGALETQIGDLKKVGKNALVIGGVIVAIYAITELLLPEADEVETKKIKKPLTIVEVEPEKEENSVLWNAMKGAATSILLTVAKDKLLQLIEHLTAKDAEPTS